MGGLKHKRRKRGRGKRRREKVWEGRSARKGKEEVEGKCVQEKGHKRRNRGREGEK